ncbi:MAG: hypothetical protein J6A28_00460 [Clostridia bacterium]|nr:hypothetical protein [Clostridia bacterium]
MWEFSLNFKSENFEIAKHVHNCLILPTKSMGGFVTSSENNGIISVLMAVEGDFEERMKGVLSGIVTEIICTKYKSDFLNRYLALPLQDQVGLHAFKKALLNFDRETDKYIVKRALCFTDSLYIDSFYAFRLKPLQEKWEELVVLSNENRDYLVSKESFIDLLKFLVDNLDICENEISVVKEDDGYRILSCENSFYLNRLISEERVVSSVIDLSPQKINLYFKETSSAINLMQRIFEERIIINQEHSNIKKFKIN